MPLVALRLSPLRKSLSVTHGVSSLTDAQLSAILVAILDILTAMNTAYADDRGQTDAIAKVRELVASQ